MDSRTQLYLASSSPRRREILDSVGLRYRVVVPDIDESHQPSEVALDYVRRVASEKALAVRERFAEQSLPSLPVLAADTIVVQGKTILGKPESEQHAYDMWRQLSGNEHSVYTAVALVNDNEVFLDNSHTIVSFKKLSDQEMKCYWQSGEPKDKAGGYAIQGLGSAWVQQIHGSYSGVVGLPLFELRNLLLKVEIDWL